MFFPSFFFPLFYSVVLPQEWRTMSTSKSVNIITLTNSTHGSFLASSKNHTFCKLHACCSIVLQQFSLENILKLYFNKKEKPRKENLLLQRDKVQYESAKKNQNTINWDWGILHREQKYVLITLYCWIMNQRLRMNYIPSKWNTEISKYFVKFKCFTSEWFYQVSVLEDWFWHNSALNIWWRRASTLWLRVLVLQQ